MFVFRVLNTVPYSNQAGAKDIVASVHSFFTSNLLVGLAVLLSYKQFGGKPIECMVPTDFTSAWVQYAENYCWAQETYYVPFSDPVLAARNGESATQKISYYQWMPFFFLFEAACFKLPCLIWKYFSSQSGMRVGEILRLASDDHNTVPEVKKANIASLCFHLQGALRFQKRLKKKSLVPHKVLRFLNIKYSTYYVVFIYFVAKFAFLLNVGLQSKLLNSYMLSNGDMESGLTNYGFDIWYSLLQGNTTWKTSGLFPRVTLCDFEVREMGNIQKHTVQCVLLLNVFTEKIFIILWAWYLILAAFTTCNLFSWAFIIFSETSKEHFIINHLEMCEAPFDRSNAENQKHVDCFIDFYLGLDGILLLQLIAQHADVVFTTELIGALWQSHYAVEEQRKMLKQVQSILPKTSVADGKKSEATTPDGPRIRNPRASIPGPALKRTTSFDDAELCAPKKFDDSSDEDSSKKSSTHQTTPEHKGSKKSSIKSKKIT
ncbi:unnamed protein product [Auanema sp. JU1783]|nr:unnamed protein product [Auanema sp. JU1783]